MKDPLNNISVNTDELNINSDTDMVSEGEINTETDVKNVSSKEKVTLKQLEPIPQSSTTAEKKESFAKLTFKTFIQTLCEILQVIFHFVLVLFIGILLNRYIVGTALVNGHSMDDSLHDNQFLIIDKLCTRTGNLNRYDIVTIGHGKEGLIKRIIGMPGDTIQIIDGSVYINGEELVEDYLKESYILAGGVAKEPYVVDEDSYFVMGDNRNRSSDSREFGNVPKSEISGKMIFSFK